MSDNVNSFIEISVKSNTYAIHQLSNVSLIWTINLIIVNSYF
jgi:hypothetical protein